MGRRERKKEETRKNIVNTAVKLFKKKGYKETLMEEISESVDVSKGTLYNYFPDKESILVEYFQNIMIEHIGNHQEKTKSNLSIKERLYKIFDFISVYFENDLELAIVFFRYRMQTLLDVTPLETVKRSGLENILVDIITNSQKNNEIRGDLSPIVIARNLQFLILSSFISNLYAKEAKDFQHSIEQTLELFLNGAKVQD